MSVGRQLGSQCLGMVVQFILWRAAGERIDAGIVAVQQHARRQRTERNGKQLRRPKDVAELGGPSVVRMAIQSVDQDNTRRSVVRKQQGGWRAKEQTKKAKVVAYSTRGPDPPLKTSVRPAGVTWLGLKTIVRTTKQICKIHGGATYRRGLI